MDLSTTAAAAAVTSATLGVLEVLHEQEDVFRTPLDYAVEGAFAASMLSSVAAYAALLRLSLRWARVAWGACAAGAALVFLAAASTTVAGEEALGAVLGFGLLALILGLLAAAAADARRLVVPPRAGMVLLLALVASVVVEATGAGGLVLAAGWTGVAALARTRASFLSPHPSMTAR